MGDIYALFYEKAFSLCHKLGVVTYITPNTWLQSIRFDVVRKFLLSNGDFIRSVVTEKVFEATVDTTVALFRVGLKSSVCQVAIQNGDLIVNDHDVVFNEAQLNGGLINLIAHGSESLLAESIMERHKRFGDFYEISTGVKPFQVGKGIPPQTRETVDAKPYVAEGKRPGKKWMPLMRGSLMHR